MIRFRSFAAAPLLASWALAAGFTAPAFAETINIGIGTQNTTSNTVTTGVVIKELGLLDKYLPKTGKYAGVTYNIDWQNFTSGPPVTNGMVANKLQIGQMGDYPLVVNAHTFQSNPDSHVQLVAVSAYSLNGSGNGLLVHKDSPYYELSDLKGKLVTVPFGSAAHGMLLKALQDHGWPEDYFQLASQSPEVGATNLQEKKIDAHAEFVPFPEELAFRGFARKIYDGVETKLPTWHGVTVRTDFSQKYPEIVVAYLKAVIEADRWVRANPTYAAEKIEEWTKIEREVIYIYLGPGGIMTLDPTIKKPLIEAAKQDAAVLQKLGKIQSVDFDTWVQDSYLRQAYKELGLDYEKQLAETANYEVSGNDSFCKKPIASPRKAGEIWVDGDIVEPHASPACTLAALSALTASGKKIRVTYLFDTNYGTKLFADKAYYVLGKGSGTNAEILPFTLRRDAVAYAEKNGGKVADFNAALAAAKTKG